MSNKPKSEAQGIQLSYRYRIYPTPEQEKALAFELVGAGVGAFAAKKSVDDNWEHIKEKQN